MSETAKKAPAKKADANIEQNPNVKDGASVPPKTKRVRVMEYKVMTSQGRFIKGQFAVLPEAEADQLIEAKQAVEP